MQERSGHLGPRGIVDTDKQHFGGVGHHAPLDLGHGSEPVGGEALDED